MFQYLKKRPFAQVGLLAAPLLVCIFLLGKYSVTYDEGIKNCPSQVLQKYNQPIIAFEFAQSPQDIQSVIGCFNAAQINQIDLANRIDFGFMFFYSLFLLLFFRVAHQQLRSKWLLIAMILPFLTFFGDWIENIQLFELTEIFRSEGSTNAMDTSLQWLQVATWTKWLALALAIGMMGLVYLQYNRISKIIGIICFLPIIMALFAYNHSPVAINQFVASIFLSFFVAIVWSWFVPVRAKE